MSGIAVMDEEEHHVDYEGEEEEEEEMGPSPALLPETREEEHHEKPSEDNTAKDEEDEGVISEDDDTRVLAKKGENAAADAPAPVLGGFLQANNPNPRLDAPLTAARSTASTKPAMETMTTTAPTKTSRWGSRRGGIARPEPAAFYMPPAKRRAMAELERERKLQAAANHGEDEKQDNGTTKEADMTAQRENWEALKKAINGTINRLNANTIKPLIGTLFETANLIRGRGLLARSLLKAAVISPSYAPVYAALVAVLNTKLPEVGELILSRSILLFRRTYKRRDKVQCLAVATFLGHLFNQSVVHELLSLQILTVLLDGDPTDDSVEVAIHYLQVVGQALSEVSPTGVHAVMERFRALLHEGIVGKRVQYQMEALMAARKRGFKEFPAIPNELDLVESDDQITFELTLDNEDLKKEEVLDMFRFDDHFKENEEEWKKIRAEILGDSDSDGDEETDSASGSESEADNDEEEEEEEAPSQELALTTANGDKQTQVIQDLSEADLVHLRRTIYLTIMSSATFEECAHKLMKLSIPDGREDELINMIIECCSQERTFLRYYGLISNRFCLLHDRWCQAFLSSFEQQYNTIHRLETNKLRNVAKLFAHLLHTDAMPWSCLSVVHMNEDETTSSSRIFVKILIQEMAEAMGMATLKERFDTANPTSGNEDSETFEWYKGMFPRDNVKHTRYAINFFTSIGLGPLTDGMREYLKNAPKLILAQAQAAAAAQIAQDDDRSTSSSSVSSTSSSSSSSSYTSSSSSSSYTSRSSRSSYSSRSRGRRRGGGGGGRGRKQKRSRSYSSRSRSSSRSSHSKRSGSRSYSRSPSRDRGRRRGRSDSRSYSRSVSYSRSPSRSPTRTKRDRSRSRDAKSPTRSKKRKTEASNAPDTKKKSVSRSVSRSPSPPRGGDRRSRSGGSKSRSYSNSRSRSPSVPKKSSKSNRRDPSPSRSRSKSVNEPNAKEDRGRSSSRSASSRSYTPSRSRSRSRN